MNGINLIGNISSYLDETKKAIDDIDKNQIDKIIDIIFNIHKKNKQIFIIGNGGSASTSMHFANDLCKFCSVENKKRFKAISLTDNISTLTAWANDASYNQVFSQQLLNFVNEGDLVIAISASGNSQNVIEAIKVAKQHKAKTIGMVGFDGGKLIGICDESLHVGSYDYGIVENAHLIFMHLIVSLIKKRLMQG